MQMFYLVWLLLFACHANAAAGECDSSSPLQIENVSVEDHVRTKFIDVLKTFGEENGFVVRIAQTTPDGEHFHIEMQRKDLTVRFLNSLDTQIFRFALYNKCVQEISKETIDSLIVDLRAKLSLVSGVELQAN